MPPLAKWGTIWLKSKLPKVSEESLEEFLLHGNAASAQAIDAIKTDLADEHIKVVNLMREHLKTYLPHVLSKINRIAFGLLSKDDIDRAAATGPVPKNRKLLAVPFVSHRDQGCPKS